MKTTLLNRICLAFDNNMVYFTTKQVIKFPLTPVWKRIKATRRGAFQEVNPCHSEPVNSLMCGIVANTESNYKRSRAHTALMLREVGQQQGEGKNGQRKVEDH